MGFRPVSINPRIPNFLSRLVALLNFMRLSLRERRLPIKSLRRGEESFIHQLSHYRSSE